ncbi:DExH-box splicing factor binding site-domain-containing protein [Talaromyces proteolyticus]|uniref:Pre-mRNA-splicing factor n=1 Tax=Talaromyces proteolyticus TaxID=1131652 RepID=A0AAD4PXG1_9EURO|nr:DExH-box splicing factor binding site-domain-containing protein [Talaromyces proteolyticus]KAH8693625.1 DExH-box splicing factor binding site-domain-containing protein [Talaromyces proteolyticus]
MVSRQDDGSESRGNAKPFSVSLSATSKNPTETKTAFRSQLPSKGPKSLTGQAQRRRAQNLYDDASDEEEAQPIHEEVVGFDSSAGGAISKTSTSEAKTPLVIKVESKNNWRNRPGINRRGKNLLPQEVQATGTSAPQTEGPSISYGLSLAPSKDADLEDVKGDADVDADMADASASEQQAREPVGQDEIALQALIRESQDDKDRKRSDLVIESSRVVEGRYDETSSFRADVATRPDQASLEAYNAIPVEEFGAALLRGMGWKEGQAIGRGSYGNSSTATKKTVPERRPGFLGIGAKDVSGGKGAEVEIGAWGKAAMRKGSRKNGDSSGNTEGVYMPVVMRNKTTGEHMTEEEFKTLQTGAKESSADAQSREKPGRDRDRDRERRHRLEIEDGSGRDYRSGRSMDSSSRRDRSRSSGTHDRRRHRYEDDKESRRYRDRSDRDYKDSPKVDYTSSRREKRDRNSDRDRDRGRDGDRDRYRREHRDKDTGRDRDRDRYKDSSRRHGDR